MFSFRVRSVISQVSLFGHQGSTGAYRQQAAAAGTAICVQTEF
jgi:hypothetical protein